MAQDDGSFYLVAMLPAWPGTPQLPQIALRQELRGRKCGGMDLDRLHMC
jgi:hypothetical protein